MVHSKYSELTLQKRTKDIDNQQVDNCINDILDELETIYQSNLTLLTNNQVELLKAIATESCVKNINANDFVKRHRLKTPEGYIINDRFFGEWLKNTVV